jgi:hypothetical protein
MSEALYDPAGTNPHYKDYMTAPSCATCRALLPNMLCPKNEPASLLQFTGMIRKSWGGW